jgi:hypothetical protein
MVEIITDGISPNIINEFKQYFEDNKHRHFINFIDDTGNLIDIRCETKLEDKINTHIENIVSKHFKIDEVTYWSAYQRQENPHNLHIDELDPEHPSWTIVIPVITDPRLKVVIFKESFTNNEKWSAFYEKCNKMIRLFPKFSKKNNTSISEDLEHTIDNNGIYVTDYLTLDTIFEYKLGSYVLFDANQVHVSSNWKKYTEYSNKELLQIHVIEKTKFL